MGRIGSVWKIADGVNALGDREERMEMGAKLNRTANDLFAFYLTHLNGEESTIVPAMGKHFTDEQIIGMQMTTMKNSSPERLAQWMG